MRVRVRVKARVGDTVQVRVRPVVSNFNMGSASHWNIDSSRFVFCTSTLGPPIIEGTPASLWSFSPRRQHHPRRKSMGDAARPARVSV